MFADIVCIALCGGILTAGGYVVGWATRNTQEAARVKHRLLPHAYNHLQSGEH